MTAILFGLTLPGWSSESGIWTVHYRRVASSLVRSPGKTLHRHAQYLIHPRPWIDAEAGRFIASLVPRNGKGLSLASCQAGSMPLYWEGEFHDLIGLTSPEYARPRNEMDSVFRSHPADIVAGFRWQQGWFPWPSVATLQDLGYEPVCLIRLVDHQPLYAGSGEFVVNFMIFARDRSLFLNLNKAEWSYAARLAYRDDTGSFERELPVREIDVTLR